MILGVLPPQMYPKLLFPIPVPDHLLAGNEAILLAVAVSLLKSIRSIFDF